MSHVDQEILRLLEQINRTNAEIIADMKEIRARMGLMESTEIIEKADRRYRKVLGSIS